MQNIQYLALQKHAWDSNERQSLNRITRSCESLRIIIIVAIFNIYSIFQLGLFVKTFWILKVPPPHLYVPQDNLSGGWFRFSCSFPAHESLFLPFLGFIKK